MSRSTRQLDEFFTANPDWVPYAQLILTPPKPNDVLTRFPDAEGSDILKRPEYFVQQFVTVLAHYMRIRLEGESHKWAEMCALGSPPAIQTDATYFIGTKRMGDEMHPKQLKQYLKIARQHGYNPGPSDIYNPSIADFPGDPAAFVPPTGGRAHAERVARARGRQLIRNGKEVVKARATDRDPYADSPKLAPDVVAANARRMLQEDPALRKKKPQEIREMVLAKHGPSS